MKILIPMTLAALVCSLAGCGANTTTQMGTTRTLITMHDSIKLGAEAADAACDQHLFQPGSCAEMKVGYEAFKEQWPKTDDALKVYLKAPTDTGMEQFSVQYQLFMTTYQQVFNALLKNGVIKLTEGGK